MLTLGERPINSFAGGVVIRGGEPTGDPIGVENCIGEPIEAAKRLYVGSSEYGMGAAAGRPNTGVPVDAAEGTVRFIRGDVVGDVPAGKAWIDIKGPGGVMLGVDIRAGGLIWYVSGVKRMGLTYPVELTYPLGLIGASGEIAPIRAKFWRTLGDNDIYTGGKLTLHAPQPVCVSSTISTIYLRAASGSI